jgi:hypothetical protein
MASLPRRAALRSFIASSFMTIARPATQSSCSAPIAKSIQPPASLLQKNGHIALPKDVLKVGTPTDRPTPVPKSSSQRRQDSDLFLQSMSMALDRVAKECPRLSLKPSMTLSLPHSTSSPDRAEVLLCEHDGDIHECACERQALPTKDSWDRVVARANTTSGCRRAAGTYDYPFAFVSFARNDRLTAAVKTSWDAVMN